MTTKLHYVGLMMLMLVSACSKSSNDASGSAEQSKRPTTLDLAVPPGLQDLLVKADSATFYTIASDMDFELGQRQELKDLDAMKLERIGTNYYVLDRVELSQEEISSVVASFQQAYYDGEEGGMMCFWPHHAIRLTKGDRVLEILICFKCRNYQVLPGGGYNNVVLKTHGGMEDAWRSIVRKYGLRDVSEKEE